MEPKELGSSEESGKDWSDLEREAAEEDKERGDGVYQDDYSKKKLGARPAPSSKDRYDYYHLYYVHIYFYYNNCSFFSLRFKNVFVFFYNYEKVIKSIKKHCHFKRFLIKTFHIQGEEARSTKAPQTPRAPRTQKAKVRRAAKTGGLRTRDLRTESLRINIGELCILLEFH